MREESSPHNSHSSHTTVVVPAPSRHRSYKRRAGLVVAIVVLCLLTGFGGGLLSNFAYDNWFAKDTDIEASQRVILNESQLISSIVDQVGDSVVSIDVTAQTTGTDMFGRSYSYDQSAAGTGVIVSEDGYVLTNRHVVDSASDVSVTMSDGTKLTDVEIVGTTSDGDSLDVAILKIGDTKGKKLTAATLGASSDVKVGDKVVAIGNALGQFQNTVTSGIISGFGRSIQASDQNGSSSETLQNLIQTDTAINSGNSGGPLVNMNGEVIGINTAVASGSAENIGFAIPIDDIRGLVTSVIKTGKFQRPYLGVRYIMLDDDYADQYNLDVKRGAYLAPNGSASAVVSGGPAAKAGLKEKDIITKIDGTSVDSTHTLTSLIGRKAVGDKVEITVIRDGKEITLTATLGTYK